MRQAAKDPFGAIRNGEGKGIHKATLPLGTVVLRKSGNVGGGMIRMIKIKMDGPTGLRWINFARWWWEKNKGSVPKGKLVIHVDGDELNDEPENLALGTPGTKFVLAHLNDPRMSRDNHQRIGDIRGQLNRQNGRRNRSRNFLALYWYPVVDSLDTILNVPFRRRKRLLGSFGADVSGYAANGVGPGVQSAIASCPVQTVRGRDLMRGKYRNYCRVDPSTRTCQGPMSGSVEQLMGQLSRMELLAPADKAARKDLKDRK